MKAKVTIFSALLGISLFAPMATYAAPGGSETRQQDREASSHYPGFGVDQGSLNTSLFNELDQNQDGTLSGEELNAYGEPAAGQKNEDRLRLLERYDANDNGMISQEEFDKGRE